jgi:CBS domain-containing protein
MTTVRNILESKGRAVWSIAPDALVFDALGVMAEKNVGALVVVNGDSLVGILSERDYARKGELQGKSSRELRVQDIMTSDPVVVNPEQSIEECMEVMNRKHIRHLPVLENKKLTGMITIRDAIKAVISEKEHTIQHLENYIRGT